MIEALNCSFKDLFLASVSSITYFIAPIFFKIQFEFKYINVKLFFFHL